MNERIHRLANQSRQACRAQQLVDPLFLEKFAELIIRECAKVVFDKTGPKSALNVLEHFGVEE